jgi:site-specific recombinase XerD
MITRSRPNQSAPQRGTAAPGRQREAGPSGPSPAGEQRFAPLLEEHLTFLCQHRGLNPATLYFHRRWGARFLQHLARHLPEGALGRLTAAVVDSFVLPLAPTVGRGTQSQMVQAARGVLRHLCRTRRVATDLAALVRGPRRYGLATLPTTLSSAEVRRLLESVDRSAVRGRRDYAVLLLLATYGLRAGEVARLRLDDIDWRTSLLRLRRAKVGGELCLPLTAAVGNALLAYLRGGRPPTPHREIFVRHDAPHTPFRQSSAIYQIVRHAFDHSGLAAPHRGPHVLRHARATALVRQGCSLKVVGDLLGHRHPDSTLPYTKLAIEDLREVALDVPELVP